MDINFDAAQPIYEQIITEIKRMIARGELSPGDKLPSQRELAKKIEVNPNTIQRAYREMEIINLIETKRGRGTFIKDNKKVIDNIKSEMAARAATRFIEEMNSLGFSFSEIVDWIENELARIKKERIDEEGSI